MFPSFAAEKRALQIAMLVACLVPLGAGLAGGLGGAAFVDGSLPLPADSHFRYLSGLLCGLGLGFLSLVPSIERQAPAMRLLTFIVVIGGLFRLLGLLAGMPGTAMTLALGMELVVTPALCLWQGRLQGRAGSP